MGRPRRWCSLVSDADRQHMLGKQARIERDHLQNVFVHVQLFELTSIKHYSMRNIHDVCRPDHVMHRRSVTANTRIIWATVAATEIPAWHWHDQKRKRFSFYSLIPFSVVLSSLFIVFNTSIELCCCRTQNGEGGKRAERSFWSEWTVGLSTTGFWDGIAKLCACLEPSFCGRCSLMHDKRFVMYR